MNEVTKHLVLPVVVVFGLIVGLMTYGQHKEKEQANAFAANCEYRGQRIGQQGTAIHIYKCPDGLIYESNYRGEKIITFYEGE